jgi:hypothetical protein
MGPEDSSKAEKAASKKNWGGARVGAGRPAKQPGQRRLALSVTVADHHWANVHVYATHHGMSASEVLDGMLAQASRCEPYENFLKGWHASHTLEETLKHLSAGRERIIPKSAPPKGEQKESV